MDYLSIREKKPVFFRIESRKYIIATVLAILTAITLMVLASVIATKPVAADDGIKEKVTDETVTTAEETVEIVLNEEDIEMLAKLVWGEARGVDSTAQKAAVIWCALNRVDSPKYPNTIAEVVTQKSQFAGYKESYPVTEELREIAEDVLARWYREKAGDDEVGRTLPSEYLFFVGDGVRNYFTVEWKSKDYYDWSLPSPYEN